MSNWKKIQRLKEHSIAKNKNLEAIYVTKENAQKISEETQAFSLMGEALLVGVMHFQSMPTWMICINPKSHKTRRYIFENERTFENYFEVMEEQP